MLGKEFHRRHRDNPCSDTFGLQLVAGRHGNFDFRPCCHQDHLTLAFGLGQNIGPLGGQIARDMFSAQRGQVLTGQGQHAGAVWLRQRDFPTFRGFHRIGRAHHKAIWRGAHHGEMLNRLVGWAILANADAVMGHHIDHVNPHQSGKSHRGARVIGKGKECPAIGAHAPMQRHTVHRCRHAMLADAVMDIAPFAVLGGENPHIARFGIVRPRQIRRAAQGFLHDRVDHGKGHFTGLAGRHFGRLIREGFFIAAQRIAQFRGNLACKGAGKLGLFGGGQGGKTGFPFGARGGAFCADSFPPVFEIGRDFKGPMRPAIGGLRISHHFWVGQCAVALGGVLRGRADCDMGFAGHHCRARACLGGRDRAVDIGGIMAVTVKHIPPCGGKAGALIHTAGHIDCAIDGDVIVIPKHNQAAEFMTSCKTDSLLADALHQAAIARDAIGVVIHNLCAPCGAQMFLGHGKANRVGNPLPQGACGRLNPFDMAKFRMARCDGAQLTEILDLLQCHLLVTCEIQQRIDQHRAMARRQNKAVAIWPVRGRCVKGEVLVKQHGRNIRHPHRHTRMARIRGGHPVKGKRADTGGAAPMVRIAGGKCRKIHINVLEEGCGSACGSVNADGFSRA